MPLFIFINIIIFRCYNVDRWCVIIQITGSLSVMCCKGLGLCIREALSGNRPLINYTFIFFIASLAICITVQVFNFVQVLYI